MDEDCLAIPDNSRDASVASVATTAATAANAANAAIDTCIFKSTHYDIANVIHIYLKDIHRYTENNTWEYLKNQSWEIDVDNKELIFSIRTTVCNAFTARSLYWANAKDADDSDSNGYSKYLDTEIISVKLLNISSKLKDNKYICVVIKECKQFFI
jgi:hypothetical protein